MYTREHLIDIIAKIMCYSASHFDDEWRDAGKNESFLIAMESISMCVACWLCQHTADGHQGVEWGIVYEELISSKWSDPISKFEAIAEQRIDLYGVAAGATETANQG